MMERCPRWLFYDLKILDLGAPKTHLEIFI